MDSRRAAALVVGLLGVLAVIAGLMYLLVASQSLPSFFPGHLAGVSAKHSTRGAAALVVGAVLLGIGVALGYRRSVYPR